MRTAIITGATSGIGAEFAKQLAPTCGRLVLVGRNTERLNALATELSTHAAIDVMVADLSTEHGRESVARRVAESDVDLVVNNAGFGLNEDFVSSTYVDERALLDVLVTSVLHATHAALPGMLERNSGGVINVSSVAGWLSSGTYSAAKSWVTTFSESLATLHRESNVHVMALCPGFTRTEFQQRAGMSTDSISQWMWLDVEHVVRDALRDFNRGKAVSVPGVQYKILAAIANYLPRPLVRRMSVWSR